MANPVRQLFPNKEAAARVILVDGAGNPYKASGGGGSGVDIQVNGVPTSDQTVLNFQNTASVTWANPSGGVVEATAPGGSGASGTWSSIGQRSTNNSGTPNTQFDLIADQVILWNPSDNTIVINNSPGTITNDVSTAGSTANGRDQAGAFSASSWIHFYWISNGTTLASLSSAVAPMTGPTLPSGYTHWAYACAVRFDGSSHLLPVRVDGNLVYYMIDFGGVNRALSNGGATSFTAIDLSALVPPNSRRCIGLFTNLSTNLNAGALFNAVYRPTGSGLSAGISISYMTAQLTGVQNAAQGQHQVLTDANQSIDYMFNAAGGTPTYSLFMEVIGYFVPNNSN